MNKVALIGLCSLFFSGPAVHAAELEEFEKILEAMFNTMEDGAKVLATVKDADTAKAALPTVKKTFERMKEIKKKMDALGQPSKDQNKKLQDKYTKKFQAVRDKLVAEVNRVAVKDYAKDIVAELQKIQ